LKLLGNPRYQGTDAEHYDVCIPFSRKLTAAEQDAVEATRLSQPLRSPAGLVCVDHDQKHLVVKDTTLERVQEHAESLKKIVSAIAAEGEEYRKRAVEAKSRADKQHDARQAEFQRRSNLARKIKFD
jgi:hypothetical protein